jgi:hypothetical protein
MLTYATIQALDTVPTSTLVLLKLYQLYQALWIRRIITVVIISYHIFIILLLAHLELNIAIIHYPKFLHSFPSLREGRSEHKMALYVLYLNSLTCSLKQANYF